MRAVGYLLLLHSHLTHPVGRRSPNTRPAVIDHGQLDVPHNGRVRVRPKPVAPSQVVGDDGAGSAPMASLESHHPGVDQFLRRQARAREEAELKKKVPCADGSKWTGKLTKVRNVA